MVVGPNWKPNSFCQLALIEQFMLHTQPCVACWLVECRVMHTYIVLGACLIIWIYYASLIYSYVSFPTYSTYITLNSLIIFNVSKIDRPVLIWALVFELNSWPTVWKKMLMDIKLTDLTWCMTFFLSNTIV